MNIDRIGSAVSIPMPTREPYRTPDAPVFKKVPNDPAKVGRSLYLITTEKHLLKRIRPIDEKKVRNHEFRNSLSTPERRGRCDWCDQLRAENPLHFF